MLSGIKVGLSLRAVLRCHSTRLG
uniref:Uncharacterized protein n=1 Tax=Anguilla anguilla TaxID=7936 RepID=A0A0E9XIR9_ANGAN